MIVDPRLETMKHAFHLVQKEGPNTIDQLSHKGGYSVSHLRSLTADLLALGLVSRYRNREQRVGRKSFSYYTEWSDFGLAYALFHISDGACSLVSLHGFWLTPDGIEALTKYAPEGYPDGDYLFEIVLAQAEGRTVIVKAIERKTLP